MEHSHCRNKHTGRESGYLCLDCPRCFCPESPLTGRGDCEGCALLSIPRQAPGSLDSPVGQGPGGIIVSLAFLRTMPWENHWGLGRIDAGNSGTSVESRIRVHNALFQTRLLDVGPGAQAPTWKVGLQPHHCSVF